MDLIMSVINHYRNESLYTYSIIIFFYSKVVPFVRMWMFANTVIL